MTISREADLFAWNVSSEQALRIAEDLEGFFGQQSQFDATHGYYVDGVEPSTAVLPCDWRERSMTYSPPTTNGVTAIVPHPEDIALSKLCAGREKDVELGGRRHQGAPGRSGQSDGARRQAAGTVRRAQKAGHNRIAAASNKDKRPWSLPGYDPG